MPSGARLKYEKNEIYDYEKVVDHYEIKTKQVEKTRISRYETYVTGYKDLGNGYFEEITDERPVYETYYESEEYKIRYIDKNQYTKLNTTMNLISGYMKGLQQNMKNIM